MRALSSGVLAQVTCLKTEIGSFDTSRFGTTAPHAVKLHNNFDHFKYSLGVNRKNIWEENFVVL